MGHLGASAFLDGRALLHVEVDDDVVQVRAVDVNLGHVADFDAVQKYFGVDGKADDRLVENGIVFCFFVGQLLLGDKDGESDGGSQTDEEKNAQPDAFCSCRVHKIC